MSGAILQNTRPGGHRFINGTAEEFAELFGYPLPFLPGGETQAGRGEVIQVVMPAELETQAGRYLEGLRRLLPGEEGSRAHPQEIQGVEAEYARYLDGLLRHILRADRRLGLLNLFWLAHVVTLRKLLLHAYPSGTRGERGKYRLWALLSGFLQRVQKNALVSLSPAEKRAVAFNLGRDYNWGLIESLLGDQFALTEPDIRDFSPEIALGAHNPAFQMEAEVFTTVLDELTRAYHEDFQRAEPEFQKLVRRRLTGFVSHHDFFGQDRPVSPNLHHSHLLGYYLGSEELPENLRKGNRLLKDVLSSPGAWSRFSEEFERVVQALQRSEYLQFIQEFVTPISPGLNDTDLKELFLEGRLYKYSLNLPIVNNFRRVVILFADIREFTRTSETAISERELTERLYDVFDPLVNIVVSLGGTVDKFTGDGMMITFGVVRSLPDSNLRALRCAIAIQEAVDRLKAAGRTSFQMGLSIHAGRVFVANFMHDDRHKETTVIGRQVNLASRISSSQHSSPGDIRDKVPDGREDRFLRMRESLRTISPSAEGAVFMDTEGNFYNVGLATSQQFVQDLRANVEMEPFIDEGRRSYRFFDRYLKSEVIFHYVGDARFKGFQDATPVYGISWRRVKAAEEAPGSAAPPAAESHPPSTASTS